MRNIRGTKKTLIMSWLVVTAVLLSLVSVSAQATQEEEQFNPDLKYAQVRQVELRESGDRVYHVSVTLRHADSGWDHYADLWQVVDDETGEVLGERRLAHPHTNEQPFTRSLSWVEIPEGVEVIRIRAKCNQHGYEGKQVRIPLDTNEGEDYRIQ
ncbi:MAG: hypothetical protein R6V86_13945 [Spirochaetia bacterium]